MLLIGLNRPDKRNAADVQLLEELSLAYGELDQDPELRCALVFGHGEHFSAGLDLADVAPRIGADGLNVVPEGGIHPWQVGGRSLTKPVVIAVQGTCLDARCRAHPRERHRGRRRVDGLRADRGDPRHPAVRRLHCSGSRERSAGATRCAGSSPARRSGAAEALRIGLVQEVVPDGTQYDRGLELARRIAAQAPLAVQAALASARLAVREGDAAAEAALQPELVRLAGTEDVKIGMQAFLTRTDAEFTGR